MVDCENKIADLESFVTELSSKFQGFRMTAVILTKTVSSTF